MDILNLLLTRNVAFKFYGLNLKLNFEILFSYRKFSRPNYKIYYSLPPIL